MGKQTQLDDTVMAGAYRECINQNLPLPEELIRWFDKLVEEWLGTGTLPGGDHFPEDVASARLSVVSKYVLGYSPQRWHEILESENA